MEVTRYIFQSPYSSAIQVGRPDPTVSSQNDSQEAVDALSKAGNTSLKEAESYKFQSRLSSVNVAVSSTDTGLSSSLDSFSSLNGQVQANETYSNS
ncbi:MAG: hypothetical protein COA44_09930 [Arcobacter sp.]|nr:MAG: hypothetical protein COA44_09930 [Arcobacter sp.]